jgi:MraZ protein
VFRGQFRHTIDPKGRLSIPARIREQLGAHGADGRLVLAPRRGRGLDVWPLPTWEELEARTHALPRLDADARRLKTFYLSLGQDVSLDPHGRIQISSEYRERAGLDKDVMIVGVQDHFEVWDTARWTAYELEAAGPIDEIFERVAAKGV